MSKSIKAAERTLVRIKEQGRILELEYDGAMTEHMGTLWWGTAVGFRAMQKAALALSQDELWSRDDLYVVSAHPGPGVRDAIDYVTRVVARDRFKCVLDTGCQMKCNSSMKFEWWVSDGQRTAAVKLRPGFVPKEFYDLSDLLDTPEETKAVKRAFTVFKVNLSTRIWNAPLDENFSALVTDLPLMPGELPGVVDSAGYWDRVNA
jgi:hypothetical protein